MDEHELEELKAMLRAVGIDPDDPDGPDFEFVFAASEYLTEAAARFGAMEEVPRFEEWVQVLQATTLVNAPLRMQFLFASTPTLLADVLNWTRALIAGAYVMGRENWLEEGDDDAD